MGNLASGVAHDFNNQLTVISGYASMLLDRETLSPQASDSIKRIFTASGQATGVVRQLMLFGRKRAPRREVIELQPELELMISSLRGLLGESIHLAFTAEKPSPRVSADITMLEQVLMSLVLNAKDAMNGSGGIEVTLSTVSTDEGAFARIAVQDGGCGMTAQVVRRLFTPFFTTKPEGRGTGLGLATSEDIVRRHGGWIEVRTQPGSGSEFRIFLPSTSAPVSSGSERAPEDKSQGRILLVEDEAGIREFAVAVLQQQGYAVLQAKSAEAALEVWKWHAPRIDLLLTDVVLPGDVSGQMLAARLGAEKPGLRTVLATGYSKEVLGGDASEATPLNVLYKPYTPRSLLKAVREALDARHGGCQPEEAPIASLPNGFSLWRLR